MSHPRRAPRLIAGLALAATLAAGLQLPTVALPGSTAQAAETAASAGSATAIQSLVTGVGSNQPNANSSESVDHLADQNSSTKWYEGSGAAPSTSSPVYAVYTLSEASAAIGYTITSGNDASNRDPKNWQVLGTNDASVAADPNSSSWTTLDTRSDQGFSQRAQVVGYSIDAPAAYTYYQLRVTANSGNTNQFQIADWTLVGGLSTGVALVDEDTSWSYWDTTVAGDATSDPTGGAADRTGWADTDAVLASGWKTGTSPFGVKKQSDGSDGSSLGGGFDAATQLTRAHSGGIVPTYFFRTSFTLSEAQLAATGGLVGTIGFDDTATVYINGQRLTGWNDADVADNTTALDFNGAGDPQTGLFTVPVAMLNAGENTIAVEVHQCNTTSSDAWFALPTLSTASDYLSLSYTSSERSKSYSSDSWPGASSATDGYVSLLSGYTDLADQLKIWGGNDVVANDEELTAENDKLIVEINNNASAEQVQRAITDANNSAVQTEYDGLGEQLGQLYLTALNSGRLPKTAEVLSHLITDDIDQHGAAKSVFQEKRPYERLGFTSNGGRIQAYDIGYGFSNDSFPSGHTTGGYTTGTTLATLLPELAPQLLERASEYGNNRIVLGFHYPIDVIGGRIGGQAMVGLRWSDAEFQQLLLQAHAEIETVLTQACADAGYGDTLTACAADANDTASAVATYQSRLDYGLSLEAEADDTTTDDEFIVPEGAADLLLTTFPDLTQEQRAEVIRQTATEAGAPLDLSASGEASWERVDLAAAMTADVQVNADGSVTVNGDTDTGEGEGEGETPDQPVIALGADTVVAGGTVQISGTGLPAGEQVGIELHSEPVSLGSATVSDTGALDVTVTIPASTEAGEHTIVVRLADDSTVTAPLTVTAAASAATDDGGDGGTVTAVDDSTQQDVLAATGLSSIWAGLGAASLLALIAGALLWAARGTRRQRE